ncbi:MAG TPA: rhomboid family intramembrane serine protease [Candidatus Syntrophoarchaeum butanivorans]|uniref:Rhomboid family intramembrane serine protease n=1 Tax=Candidatus Syntropharchaeum butanivorans TaxID=1839936 RepID=A0A7C0X3J3_9EURY|nr:MAG: rhomboid family intramembrane serine protease [Candidatus Syntrophoarchaeum sp. WYZ-LMO15]HDM36811.1 rhomboid family intramembrane serine protease [Candidatus Syntrophoarchaeum butanivorans]
MARRYDGTTYYEPYRYYVPYKNYSLYLIGICIVVYFLQLIPHFTYYFALSAATLASHPWTLVTHIFLHGSMGHLFFNMLFLLFFGPALEQRVGSNRFLFIFLLCGILGGVGHILTSPSSSVIGASGALYGILGVLAILEPDMIIFIYFIPMRITFAVLLLAAFDILMARSGDMIAHTAHLSGLVGGILIGKYLKKEGVIKQRRGWRLQ